MPHYIALIHEDDDSCFEVSFPDIPGIFTAGDTFDEALEEAAEALAFAAEDWTNADGSTGFKPPRTIEQLRRDPEFIKVSKGAIVAMIEFPTPAPDTE